MKPAPFAYAAPDNVEEVLDLLAEHGDEAAVIAGGQSLVPLLNLRLAQPSIVVDPRRCAPLHELALGGGGLRAGAMVTAAELERAPGAETVAGLRAALGHLGHVQIRNRTTVGGSVAHADPAAELPALLLASDGAVHLQSSARGERRVAAADFFQGPLMTDRRPDELVVAVELPAFPGPMVVRELCARPGDFATVGVVVGLAPGEARVVVFGAAGRAQRIPEAEALVTAGVCDTERCEAVAEAVRSHAAAIDDAHASGDFRRHVAGTLAARALQEVGGS